MSLLDTLKKDHTAARLARNTNVSGLLALVLGEIQNATVGRANAVAADDASVIKIITTLYETNNGTLATLKKRGDEYAAKIAELEEQQQALLPYIPLTMSDEQLALKIAEAVFQHGHSKQQDVMKWLRENFPAQYDGKKASEIYRNLDQKSPA